MRTAARIVAGLAIVFAAACGSDDDPPPASSDTLSAVDGGSSSIEDLIQALDGVGCPLEEVDPTEGFDIYRQASCPDAELQVYTFTSKASRDEVVEAIGGLEGEFAVVGANWVAEVRSRSLADAVKAKVGGTIQTSTG
jgi:hypothetical protein